MRAYPKLIKNATSHKMPTCDNSKYSQKIQPTFKTGITVINSYTEIAYISVKSQKISAKELNFREATGL